MVKAFGYRRQGGPDVQELLEIDMPTPLARDVLIQVRAAGVNPVDWKIRSGVYGTTPPDELPTERKLDPHVEDVVPLERAADALAALEGGHAKGKVVIEVG